MRIGPGVIPRFEVRLWGVRGSLPVWGPEFQRYGGNTICVEMRCGDHVILFDAGTGIARAGVSMRAERITELTLFFSHAHYDHIVGLPFFAPLYDPTVAITIASGHLAGRMSTREMLQEFMRLPFFPIGPEAFAARVETRDFKAGDTLEPYPGLTVRTAPMNHPGGCVGYRVEWAGRAVAFVTDTEHEAGRLDPAVLGLIDGADLFLYDAAFTDEDYAPYCGFGHSTWQQGLRLAAAAGVSRAGFFHHAEWRTDAALDAMALAASAVLPGAFFASDYQTIEV